MAHGDRWNLDNGYASSHDPATQKRDMPVECGNARVSWRLARGQEIPDLAEQIITNTYKGLALDATDPNDGLSRVWKDYLVCATGGTKADDVPIDGDALTIPRHDCL